MWLLLGMALAASVLGHAGVLRLFQSAGAVTTFVAIGGAVGVLLVGCSLFYDGLTPTASAVVLTYVFACELYVFLFTLVGNSVSFGLMAQLAQHPLQPADIAKFYRAQTMVERRFEQLERANLIVRDGAGFRLTVRAKRIIRAFSVLRSVFRRPHAGPLMDEPWGQ